MWQECGWGEAANRAFQEAKFLFVYLHSPQHQVSIPLKRKWQCVREKGTRRPSSGLCVLDSPHHQVCFCPSGGAHVG